MDAPVGALDQLKVRGWAGRSASVAVAVKVSRLSSAMLAVANGAKTGATLTSLTVTVISSVSHDGVGVVADLDGEGIAAGTLGFGGRPGEGTRGRNGGTGGNVPIRLKVRG